MPPSKKPESTRAGRFVTQLQGYKAFQPSPLPPALKQDEEMTDLLNRATHAVGKLSGLSSIIPNLDLFVYLYVRKEALLSSQIEGTQCSLEDILNTKTTSSQDIEEVSSYINAMNQGLTRLAELPMSARLIKDLHTYLMHGVRGSNKTPGEFRRSQNWIGRPGSTLTTAAFVPPPPEDVARLIVELEQFIHGHDKIPLLIKIALIHAQFETIHPFLDGNGRLGRLLITFLLVYWQVLETPLLYTSYYFKAHRTEYYTRLMDIRLHGNWEAWITFFLRAVLESAEMSAQSAIEIHKLITTDRARIHTPLALRTYDLFCREPTLTNPILVMKLKSSKPTVQRALNYLQNLGIIQKTSTKRPHRYTYQPYLDVLTRDTLTQIG